MHNVSAIIVTRGNVDLAPVLDSLPPDWEQVIWDNGKGVVDVGGSDAIRLDRGLPDEAFDGDRYAPEMRVSDLSVFGRYAAIEFATWDLIFVQDDDVIVSDPQAIVGRYIDEGTHMHDEFGKGLTTYFDDPGCVVANMPQEFRHDGYTDSCLVGFGACFHRDAPQRAFDRMRAESFLRGDGDEFFQRTCDVVFTTLTPRALVDVPKIDREFASDPDRMWKQPNHHGERTRMLDLVRQVRDS
jgi:hypothetical protein